MEDDGGKDWSCAATSQGHQEPPKARISKEGFSRESSEGTWPCQSPDFRFLASRTERIHFCCF